MKSSARIRSIADVSLVATDSAHCPSLSRMYRSVSFCSFCTVQEYLRIESFSPFDHRRVEMRMRNRDGADAATRIYLGDCFVIQQRDAIPEQISSRRLQKQSALGNRDFRFSADPQKLRRFLFDAVVMISAQLLERCPFLASVTDELPFILANWTARRRFRSFTKLRPALRADKVLHQQKSYRSRRCYNAKGALR